MELVTIFRMLIRIEVRERPHIFIIAERQENGIPFSCVSSKSYSTGGSSAEVSSSTGSKAVSKASLRDTCSPLISACT